MIDPERPPTARPTGSLLCRAAIPRALCLIAANVAVLLLLRILIHRSPLHMQWWLQALAAAALLLASLFIGVHQLVYWHIPTRRLAALLPLLRNGEAPIEELRDIGGGLQPLIADLQEILRDLRRQRRESESEMRRRLANRTDALEHSLGVMRQQASRDALSGLLNRRSLDETLPKIIESCRCDDIPLAVMMTDVDNFKPLNDSLGHAAGDALLRSLGQLLRSTLRDSDLPFRYGGDEFVLVLPATSLDQAHRIAERLTVLVDQLTRPIRVKHQPRLSIGLVAFDSSLHRDAEEFLRHADRALYQVKAKRQPQRQTADDRISA